MFFKILHRLMTPVSVLFVLTSCALPLLPVRENSAILVTLEIPDNSNSTLPLSISRALSRPTASPANPATRNLVVTVSGDDMPLIIKAVEIPDGAKSVSFELEDVPGGDNRSIKVFLYNKDEILLAEGSIITNLKASTTKHVSMTAQPVKIEHLIVSPFSADNASTNIFSSSKGQLLVFSIDLPVSHRYSFSVSPANGTMQPSLYTEDGQRVILTLDSPSTYSFTSSGQNTYYISLAVPLDYAGGAAFTITPDFQLHVSGYNKNQNEIFLSWAGNETIEETYSLKVGDTNFPIILIGTNVFSIPLPEQNVTITLQVSNAFGTAFEELEFIPATSISFEKTHLVMAKGNTEKVGANVMPADASLAPFLEWDTDTNRYLSISKDGILTALEITPASPVLISALCGTATASLAVKIGETSFAGGKGTSADPYIVATASQLDLVRFEPMASYTQSAHIDLKNVAAWEPIGTEILAFSGSYDGNGFTITNLNIQANEAGAFGLFGVTEKAQLKRIALLAVNARTGESVKDNVSSLGALVGNAKSTTINRCYSTGLIDGGKSSNVGGLIGMTSSLDNSVSVISESYSSAVVSGEQYVGGFIGSTNDALSRITTSYATGKVMGVSKVGGFGGKLMDTTFCYSTGFVSAVSEVGGFAGVVDGSSQNCVWDIDSSFQQKSASGIGKTTAEMIDPSVFSSWDISTNAGSSNVWVIVAQSSYPYLRWQGKSTMPVPIRARYVLEGSGLVDVIGNRSGVFSGNPDFTGNGVYSGNSMRGFSQDPFGSYGLLPADAIDSTGDYSLSVWVKMIANPQLGVKNMIIGQIQDVVPGLETREKELFAFALFLSDGRPCFWTGDKTSAQTYITAESTVSIADGVWHHVVAVRNGNKLELYVDGVWKSDSKQQVNKRITDPVRQQIAIGVLKNEYNKAIMPFTGGEIDKIAFFNQALTPDLVSWIRRYDSQN